MNLVQANKRDGREENREDHRVNLFDFSHDALVAWLVERGEKPFRAKQLMRWLYHEQVIEFDEMTDISKGLRTQLAKEAVCRLPEIMTDKTASDGTRKWVLRYPCGNSIEMVFIPEQERGTLCISSQAGCALACTFCSTGHAGFNRNLNTGEIVAQVWLAKKLLGCQRNGQRVVTNVVLMGMGEPLVNFNQVIPATAIFLDDRAFGLSKRRVTLSTAGIVPAIYDLANITDVSLAVSLHAPNDQLRNQIMPINARYGLAALLEACNHYVRKNKQHGGITWEYVMLKGVNDSLEHAKELAALLRNNEGKINLIPFNPFAGSRYECASRNKILAFQRYLTEQGYVATIRKTRGEDIDAACGQLVGRFLDRSRREARMQRQFAASS